MPNGFSKEERVMFDQVLEGFDDQLVIAKEVEVYNIGSAQEQQRMSDRVWRPMPYIAVTYDGFDQSSNFGDITQLSVPAIIGQHKSAPGKFTSKDLRDQQQLSRYGEAAKLKLSSDINYAIYQTVALQGSIVSKRTVAATGFDDVALIDAQMTELGVPLAQRKVFYGPRDYNNMASTIAKPQTSAAGKAITAYERATIGNVAGIDVFKNDQWISLTAAAATGVTMNGANQRYVPASVTTDASGNTTNVDNRYQTISITVTSGTVKVGDAFTIAGVNAVHPITKQSTGQLKTFRIVSIVTGAGGTGTVQITPPIIAADSSPTRAELQYKNVTATPANGANITFLNTTTAAVNPFFVKPAVELLPGTFAVDPQDGWQVLRATTDMGVGITYARQGEINDLTVKYRWDVDFGVAPLNTEMMGIQMFSQA
jgi:hypothetical protein